MEATATTCKLVDRGQVDDICFDFVARLGRVKAVSFPVAAVATDKHKGGDKCIKRPPFSIYVDAPVHTKSDRFSGSFRGHCYDIEPCHLFMTTLSSS